MYNFSMSKKQQAKILEDCNFSELERYIFNNLAEEKTRTEVYELVYKNFNKSSATVNKIIKNIANKISNSKKDNDILTSKVYIHKFPNGKKYVGVCISCEDRWGNGNGYAYNKEMYKDIKKYGWNNIEHKILLETTDSVLAYKLEKVLIDELDLINNGYNNE